MTGQSHPAAKFIEVFKSLAEGRYDLPAWLAWWEKHKAEIEATLLPGWTLRLRPRADPLITLLQSQAGACYILDALRVPYEKSNRYELEWQQGFAQFRAEQKAKSKERVRQHEPGIKALAKHFPKFARFLRKRVSDIETMEPPITAEQMEGIERSLGVALPQIYKQFLLCTRSFRIGELDFCVTYPDIVSPPIGLALPTEGMLVIADYFLEADGDQILFAADNLVETDPPVFYYAHESSPPRVHQLDPRFSTWLESLPNSPMFE